MTEPIDLAVCDVSFISVTMILPAVAAVLAPNAEMVILVKPQFELARNQVARGGVIRDPALHQEACDRRRGSRPRGLGFARKSYPLRCSAPRGTKSSSSMPDIKLVGIIAKPGIPHASAIVPKLVAWLSERGIAARLDEEAARYLEGAHGIAREEVPEGTHLVIVLGGDGTLLSAARAVAGREIPIFPVNLGGLGFLTAITLDELYPELERALEGQQRVVPRRMLHCDLLRAGRIIKSYEALNDVVINKTEIARMIEVEALVDNQYVSTYRADGLIVATPTGSTAYSLSAGGPIVFPAVAALCITPVCPHMLTNRPVLVPDTSVIEIICRAMDHGAFLTVDGQIGEPLLRDDHVVCRSSSHSVHLIRPPKMFFFDVLREKLKWGER